MSVPITGTDMIAFGVSFLATFLALLAVAILRRPVPQPVSREHEVRDFMRSVSAWEHGCR